MPRKVMERLSMIRKRNTVEFKKLIAAQAGYADGTTLRALLRRKIGRAASELRVTYSSFWP